MKLTIEQMEDNGICQTCCGKGTYGALTGKGEDMVHEIKYCEDCGGTGRAQEDGDVD